MKTKDKKKRVRQSPISTQKGSTGINVTHSKNGRTITLDAIMTFTIPIELREVESTIPCGFRTGWIEGENEGKKISLASGAGCGSAWLTFGYGERNFCVNMEGVLRQFVDAVDAKSVLKP